MSKNRYTSEQIIGKLREAKVALILEEMAAQVCRINRRSIGSGWAEEKSRFVSRSRNQNKQFRS